MLCVCKLLGFTLQMKQVLVFHLMLMNQCKVTYFELLHNIGFPKRASSSIHKVIHLYGKPMKSKLIFGQFFLEQNKFGVVSSEYASLEGQLLKSKILFPRSFQSCPSKSLALTFLEAEKCITPMKRFFSVSKKDREQTAHMFHLCCSV